MSDENKPSKTPKLPDSVTKQLAALSTRFDREERELDGIMNPRRIKAYLDRFVIKQDKAKKLLSTVAHKHMLRIKAVIDGKGVIPQRTNCLLLGKTGTGKTFLVANLAKLMKLPFTNIDCSSLSSVGYKGASLADFADTLLNQSKALYNTDKYAQFSIVQLDEIDKLRPSGSESITTTKIQDELLRMIEGGEVEGFSCENIFFIASGAFEGQISEDMEEVDVTMGFGGEETRERVSVNDQLIAWGLKPELIGRLSAGTVLEDLERDDLITIMTEAEGSTLENHIAVFADAGVPLRFTKGALEAVADMAIAKGTGARSLTSVLEFTLAEHQFDRLGGYDETPIVIKKRDIREY